MKYIKYFESVNNSYIKYYNNMYFSPDDIDYNNIGDLIYGEIGNFFEIKVSKIDEQLISNLIGTFHNYLSYSDKDQVMPSIRFYLKQSNDIPFWISKDNDDYYYLYTDDIRGYKCDGIYSFLLLIEALILSSNENSIMYDEINKILNIKNETY